LTSEQIDIVAEAQVKQSESKEKVAKALSNLFGSSGELRFEEDRVLFLSSDTSSLQFLRDQFRDRHVRAAARRLLLTNSDEGSLQTVLLLNKQAATVSVAALCDDPSESPLGPIVLRIRSENLKELIDWLSKGYDSAGTS
jgi:predicted RNA binding protein with dsRBD fold (UPF0201 family)